MIHRLPPELLEKLLMSSACFLAKTLFTTTDLRPDVETFVTLASVALVFRHILTERKSFARTFQRYLTDQYPRRPPLVTYNDGPDYNSPDGQSHRRAVRGLTILDKKLFVVYRESDTINVYATQKPYTKLANILVNGLNNPGDIASCSINNCLYVADLGGGCVWKVREGKVEKRLKAGHVQRLSVTSEGHIVMLVSEPYGVDVFDTDGVKLSSLLLPRDLGQPWHVVRTVNKSFIVCHTESYDSRWHRVCEVNNEGVLVKSYGESPGSKSGQLDWPRHIALDSERVFVAEWANGRVISLDRNLKFERVLLTLQHVHPKRLFYDREIARLMVGLSDGQVGIFSLSML
jgi:hypothetical protein